MGEVPLEAIQEEKQSNEIIDWERLMNFLDKRFLEVDKTKLNPSRFPELKKQMLEEIYKEQARCKEEGESQPTEKEIKGFFQYCPRSIERSGGDPKYINLSIPYYKGHYSEESFVRVEKFAEHLYPNFEEEMDKFEKEHGDEIREIMKGKGNVVFICTHPSWYSLLIPYFLLARIDKSFIQKGKISITLAGGPMMSQFDIMGGKGNPRDMLQSLGVNILTTMPPNKEYEKDPDIREVGEEARNRFGIKVGREMVRMISEGERSISIAAEGTTTLRTGEDHKYEISPIKEGTEKLLKGFVERTKNTHFMVCGISEEDKNTLETESKNLTLKTQLIMNEELKEMTQNEEVPFRKQIELIMADLVDGRLKEEA